MPKPDNNAMLMGILEDYEEYMSREPVLTDEQIEAEKEFLRRVLGPERYAWLERGEKYGYGASYDPDESEEE